MTADFKRRAALIEQARQLADIAAREGRELTADEIAREAALWEQVDQCDAPPTLPFDNDANWTAPPP